MILSAASQQRIDYKERLMKWLLPNLSGDKEQLLNMVMDAMDQSYDDGLADAQELLAKLKDAAPGNGGLGIAYDAIRTTRRVNAMNGE